MKVFRLSLTLMYTLSWWLLECRTSNAFSLRVIARIASPQSFRPRGSRIISDTSLRERWAQGLRAIDIENDDNHHDDNQQQRVSCKEERTKTSSSIVSLIASTAVLLGMIAGTTATSLPADAADSSGVSSVASSIVAYVHYAGILAAVSCLAAERLLVSRGAENFTEEDEDLLVKVDATYGIVGIPVIVSGILRVTEYGKGFDFYKNCPFFWLKIAFAGVLAASSFFPTATVIKRAVERKDDADGAYVPMSEKLIGRMTAVINAELTGIFFIPFTATLMARGVGYNEVIPWEVEAGLAATVFAGASFKYLKEALTWSDE